MNLKDKPAILGGIPIFNNLVPLTRPTLPSISSLSSKLKIMLKTGQISNFGIYTKELEEAFCKYINVENALALANGTTGSILILKALDLKGKVIIPSFVFSSTVHALKWCDLEPVFIDIDPHTFNIDCNSIEEIIDKDTSAIFCVNCFGVPCDIDWLTTIASKHNLALLFDSAHACGSKYKNKLIGQFGQAEVFSTSATKMFTTGEGGFITTNYKHIADQVRILRNYGNAESIDQFCIGLNGKMNELSAILGLSTIGDIDKNVNQRNRLANLYRNELKDMPGIGFQCIPNDCISTYKDFIILIDKTTFGISRDLLANALTKENIQVKSYFYPPMHKHPSYCDKYKNSKKHFPNTDYISDNILSLPMYSHMEESIVYNIAEVIKRIQKYKTEISKIANLLLT